MWAKLLAQKAAERMLISVKRRQSNGKLAAATWPPSSLMPGMPEIGDFSASSRIFDAFLGKAGAMLGVPAQHVLDPAGRTATAFALGAAKRVS